MQHSERVGNEYDAEMVKIRSITSRLMAFDEEQLMHAYPKANIYDGGRMKEGSKATSLIVKIEKYHGTVILMSR